MNIVSFMIGCCALLLAGEAMANLPFHSAGLISDGWSLRQFEGHRVKPNDPEAATIRFFADHRIGGTAACNGVGGDELTWSTEFPDLKGAFKRNQTGATIITSAGCANTSAMQLGGRFWARMSNARDWSANATTLTVTFSDGSVALLERTNRG